MIPGLNHQSKDLRGIRFGWLVVMELTSDRVQGRIVWRCRCDCGEFTTAISSKLTSGVRTSCGCKSRERRADFGNRVAHPIKHGLHLSPEYRVWIAMRQRCSQPNHTAFKHYGGRGIRVCERWDSDFVNFYADMGPRPSMKHTIDRIDNNGNYEPPNCRWVTQKEQMRNIRTNRILTHDGTSLCIAAWAEKTGIKEKTLSARSLNGWSDEDILTRPLGANPKQQRLITYLGKTARLSEWADGIGIKRLTLHQRLKRGWTLDKAMSPEVRHWPSAG